MKNEYYDTEEAYLDALADALRVEYEAIVGHGFLLQLDCPDLALERHITYQDRPLAEFLGFAERVVAAINRALANVPRERVRMHVCWGNYEGPHDLDVPLAEILPVIRQARSAASCSRSPIPRHAHEYRCFVGGVLDDDQILVAGVIDTLTNFVEHPEVVADRIERVARALGDPRRVLAGTDCGFDTSAGMGRVAEDVVWAKLEALAEGARLASERLFHGRRHSRLGLGLLRARSAGCVLGTVNQPHDCYAPLDNPARRGSRARCPAAPRPSLRRLRLHQLERLLRDRSARLAAAGDGDRREGELDAVGVEGLLDQAISAPPDDELLARLGHHLHPNLDREIAELLDALHLQWLDDVRGELRLGHDLLAHLLDHLLDLGEVGVKVTLMVSLSITQSRLMFCTAPNSPKGTVNSEPR